jgi:LPS sulfotransferase NodH
MFPHAKIIRCQRNARDTALSLWMQCFLEDVQGYAYDFDDIAVVMRDCDRLMDHWRQRYADAIRTVRYEDLVAEPLATIADLAQWVGLPAPDANEPLSPEATTSPISTASLWQARQPVNTRSIERWRHYAPYMPELLRIPET